MKRKFEIPPMSNTEIAKLYKNIKPIVKNEGIHVYLRELTDEELTNKAYTWFDKPSDFAEPVDYNQLSVLTDIKMLHKWGYYAFFKPSVGEVIRQIPKEYLEKTIAFEIIASAIGINTVYSEELNAGFHVSIVRLYQKKDDTNKEAHPLKTYPEDDSKVPIGMDKKDFETIFGI